MAFETFDLGRAYSDAARIKALEAETVDRTRRTDLYEQSLTSQSQEDQQTAQLQDKWAELQASKKNSVWRAKIAAEIRASAPQFADRDDDEVIAYAEAGIAQKLGIPQTPKDIGTLYATGTEGTYLPADQAVGKTKFQEPEKPEKTPRAAPAHRTHVSRRVKRDGKTMIQHGSYNPNADKYVWEEPVETESSQRTDEWGDLGSEQPEERGMSKSGKPMVKRDGVWYYE